MSQPPTTSRPIAFKTSDLLKTFLRSLSLQASWNPQRMQNLGLLVTLLPWLRSRAFSQVERRYFFRKHYQYFNTNPYLANYIIGGLLHLESSEGSVHGPGEGLIPTFKNTLARSFASLGDQFFWLGLKPALLLLICLLALWDRFWLVLAVILLFTVFQLILRWRALLSGYQLGVDLVEMLAKPIWHQAILQTKRAGMILTGLFAGAYVVRLWESGAMPTSPTLLITLIFAVFVAQLTRTRLGGEGAFLLVVPLALALAYG